MIWDRGRLLGLRVALSQTGPSHSCDRARSSPRKARHRGPGPAGMAGRGCPGSHWSPQVPPDPGSAQCATPGQAPAAAASAVADTVGYQAGQSRPLTGGPRRSVPLSLAASRARTQNSNDPASGMCRRTSRSCCGTVARQHCLRWAADQPPGLRQPHAGRQFATSITCVPPTGTWRSTRPLLRGHEAENTEVGEPGPTSVPAPSLQPGQEGGGPEP